MKQGMLCFRRMIFGTNYSTSFYLVRAKPTEITTDLPAEAEADLVPDAFFAKRCFVKSLACIQHAIARGPAKHNIRCMWLTCW